MHYHILVTTEGKGVRAWVCILCVFVCSFVGHKIHKLSTKNGREVKSGLEVEGNLCHRFAESQFWPSYTLIGGANFESRFL